MIKLRSFSYLSLVLLLVGCTVSSVRNNISKGKDDKNITPGVGLAGCLEIGMKLEDIKILYPDFNIKADDLGVEEKIPSVGAFVFFKTKQDPLSYIDFFVTTNVPYGMFSFKGKVDGKLDLTKPRKSIDIYKLYGRPLVEVDYEFPINKLGFEPYRRSETNRETIYYPRKGIGFFLKDGVIEHVLIWNPAEKLLPPP